MCFTVFLVCLCPLTLTLTLLTQHTHHNQHIQAPKTIHTASQPFTKTSPGRHTYKSRYRGREVGGGGGGGGAVNYMYLLVPIVRCE